MKQLITTICFLFTVIITSAQAGGYNPIKNIKMDVSWNETIAHGGFGWSRTEEGTITNYTGFANYTDETLDIHLRIPAIGIDTVVTVPPTTDETGGYWFVLGYDLIPSEGWLINPLMIECTVDHPIYSTTLRYIWFRGAKKYF